jgi:hypothetical protein
MMQVILMISSALVGCRAGRTEASASQPGAPGQRDPEHASRCPDSPRRRDAGGSLRLARAAACDGGCSYGRDCTSKPVWVSSQYKPAPAQERQIIKANKTAPAAYRYCPRFFWPVRSGRPAYPAITNPSNTSNSPAKPTAAPKMAKMTSFCSTVPGAVCRPPSKPSSLAYMTIGSRRASHWRTLSGDENP